jgi:hypothetical protein
MLSMSGHLIGETLDLGLYGRAMTASGAVLPPEGIIFGPCAGRSGPEVVMCGFYCVNIGGTRLRGAQRYLDGGRMLMYARRVDAMSGPVAASTAILARVFLRS